MNIDDLTSEQLEKIRASVAKQKEYRKRYNENNKDKIRAYHRAYNTKRNALIRELKDKGLL